MKLTELHPLILFAILFTLPSVGFFFGAAWKHLCMRNQQRRRIWRDLSDLGTPHTLQTRHDANLSRFL